MVDNAGTHLPIRTWRHSFLFLLGVSPGFFVLIIQQNTPENCMKFSIIKILTNDFPFKAHQVKSQKGNSIVFNLLKKKLRQKQAKSFQVEPTYPAYPVPLSQVEKAKVLGELLGHSNDIIFRRFNLGFSSTQVIAVFAEGLVDVNTQNESLFKPLMFYEQKEKNLDNARVYESLKENYISVGEIAEFDDLFDASHSVLSGDTVLLMEGIKKVLTINTRSLPQRSIEEPKRETIVRGPQEAFTELLRTNIALLRRRLKHPDLVFETRRGGTYTYTEVAIVYLRGLASPKIVEEVRRRMERIIHTDHVLESGMVEELIEDSPYSPFPQIEHTERPDKAVAQLLEGRVIILIDGTPFTLIVPTLFWQFIQTADDYYERMMGSFVRVLRLIAFFVALFLPSLYIALTTYHQEMIPFSILVSINVAREGVPFPAFVEALIMEGIFELLREAGIRIPAQIGQAVSIVGAIILGQAAIQAKLVSPAMVIIVAVTAISSFLIPAFNFAIALRILRFGVMILAATLGLFGILVAAMFLLTHLVSLRSFGIPYMAPLAPLNLRELKDVFLRLPKWVADQRPSILKPLDKIRQKSGLKPQPNKD